MLTLTSQLCRPRRCNVPGQATRNHWRAAVPATPIRNSSTTARRRGRPCGRGDGGRIEGDAPGRPQLRHLARCSVPGQATRNHWRAAVPATLIFSKKTWLSPFQTSPPRRAPHRSGVAGVRHPAAIRVVSSARPVVLAPSARRALLKRRPANLLCVSFPPASLGSWCSTSRPGRRGNRASTPDAVGGSDAVIGGSDAVARSQRGCGLGGRGEVGRSR